MALTYNVPSKEWYKYIYEPAPLDLDYPPLFAWFEYVLGWFSDKLAGDPVLIQIHPDGYSSPQTVTFMRLSVMISELLLVYAIWE
jgi:alpha-1,3-glucosyltransferase